MAGALGSGPEARCLIGIAGAPLFVEPGNAHDGRDAVYDVAWARPPDRSLSLSAVASWAEFEAAEPEFASRVRAQMASRKHLTMATLRGDGSPRISGTEVEFADGQLQIGSMRGAVKALDLRRDPRVAIHGPTDDPPAGNPAGWKGEAKVAGTAIEVESGSADYRFLIDIHEAVITHLNQAGSRLMVESWNAARGYRTLERA